MRSLVQAIGLAVLLSTGGVSFAQEKLTIAVAQDINTVDPHFHSLYSNNSLAITIFDGIVRPDATGAAIPGLAESWKLVDPSTWEFTLRPGVKFHDGTPVTSEDVRFSFERAASIKDSPSGGMSRALSGKKVEVVSDNVFRIVTETPMPSVLTDLVYVVVLSKAAAENATREDFNSGKAAIGTGPYKFVSWTPGQSIELERNEEYWGEKPDFKHVSIRAIPSDPTRVAALLAGDVDVIGGVPSDDIQRLENEEGISIFQRPGRRVMYMHMDQFREQTPDALSVEGAQIKNPLFDRRVRLAISHSINRDALVENIMNGAAESARQYAPESSGSLGGALEQTEYNVEKAKQLLTEAGFPQGFKMKVHGASDGYPKGKELVEAIGQMMTRAGIQTEVVTMPSTIFYRRGASGGADGTPEFSINFQGCCSSNGEPIAPLVSLMYTFGAKDGLGTANRGRYSNPALDALIEKGLAEMDETAQKATVAKAMDMAIEDMAVVPVMFHSNVWATRGQIEWMARSDEVTVASDASLK